MINATNFADVPPLPQVGLPESDYVRMARLAEAQGHDHLHEALKVAQYVTLGLQPDLAWPARLKCFRHAIKHHCNAPSIPNERVWDFYDNLVTMVRDACGQEALRLASREDDIFAKQVRLGRPIGQVEEDAQKFFDMLMGRGKECPCHFHPDDWEQLRVFRDQWV